MATSVYDVVVVGAGSVGMPTAMYLAEKGLKVLCLDQFASPGQESNKAAIGGLRATHSSPAKIRLCLDSLRTFSTWKEAHGFDIEWKQGGYLFVAYRPEEATTLKELLVVQKAAGLDIALPVHAADDATVAESESALEQLVAAFRREFGEHQRPGPANG